MRRTEGWHGDWLIGEPREWRQGGNTGQVKVDVSRSGGGGGHGGRTMPRIRAQQDGLGCTFCILRHDYHIYNTHSCSV